MISRTVMGDRKHIIEKTGDLWEALRDARIFITGGTGFVGTWLMEAFAEANRQFNLRAEAVLLTRNPDKFRERVPHLGSESCISFVAGDATNFEAPDGAFPFVIHAATERSFEADRARPLSIVEPDLIATRRVLSFAGSHGTHRFLFTSSGAVYGAQAAALNRIPETYAGAPDPLDPRAAYGESKRLSEFACASYARVFGFDAIVARLFAFAGPHLPLDEGYAVGNFVGNALKGEPIAIAGDGTARRSYLYAADLAIWLWTMLLRGDAGKAYNVGSPEAVSIRELANTVVDSIAPGSQVQVARAAVMGAAPSSYVPDTSRAQTELGLKPWIGLSEALRRTYDFYLENIRTTTTP